MCDERLRTQEDFVGLTCKVVASVESSAQDYSVETKVEEVFHLVQSTKPFQRWQEFKSPNRLDEELNSIDKLKRMYETRNDNRIKTYSTQYSEKPNSEKPRSVEKRHLLKPSQTPVLTKRFQATQKTQYGVEESQQKLVPSCFQTQPKSINKSQVTLQEESKQEVRVLLQELNRLRREAAHKDQSILQLSTTISSLRRERTDTDEALKESYNDNRIMKLDVQKLTVQKQQLQTILKDLLYERERERLLQTQTKECPKLPNVTTLNVTSSRKSFTPGKQPIRPSPRDQNSNSNHLFQKVTSVTKPAARDKGVVAEDSENKKMKVQSILEKLKIKINRA